MADPWDNSRGDGRVGRPQGPDGPDLETLNTRRLLMVALAGALALLFASVQPAPLVAPILSQLLAIGAFGALLGGVLRREPMNAPFITGWDQAAMLMLASLFSGFFVDGAAASRFLEDAGILGAAGP